MAATTGPDWLVTVAPIENAPSRPGNSEDSHEFGGFVARVANDGRRVATFFLDSSRRKKELDAALSNGLHLLLRREGRLDLHAAAVAPGPSDGAVLIIGPKGAGKSSLTIATAIAGWSFLSDDYVVVWSEDDEVRVAGLRVPLFLTPDAAERLPSHLPKGQNVPSMGKRMFQPENLFPGQRLNEARIAAVVFPERAVDRASSLERLRPLDCFHRILAVSPFLATDPSAKPCLGVARRVADFPAFVLHAGPDLLDPQTAARVLGAAFQR